MSDAHARTTDPDTSHEAADSVWEPTTVQQHVLETLSAYETITGDLNGLTDDEIYTNYTQHGLRHGWVIPTPQSIRSRRKELERRGLIYFTESYGLTDSGRRTRKWSLN
jgi:hypothetical protein